MIIPDLLARGLRYSPASVAVRDADGELRFTELAGRVTRLARGLVEAGAGHGDRVAVVARNRADYVALYFAAARVGAVLVPLNWRLAAAELAWILADAAPRVVVADAKSAPACVDVDAERYLFDGEAEGWRPLDALLDSAADLPPRPVEHDVAVQMYTSGTTGKPKGAMLTHRNVVSMTTAWLLDMTLVPGASRFLQVTPLFHVGGMMMLMSNAAMGTTLRLLPEFDPVDALDALSEEGITHTLLVPSMVQWILLEPALAGRAFPALELIVYGASPMPTAVLERAIEVFDCDFLQGYGLTESAGVLLTLRPEDHRYDRSGPPPRRLAAAGRPLFCSDVRVVDDDGNVVPPGVVGEIVARGDNLSPGYWNDPAATAAAFRNGWFCTGDLATVDEDGYVYVVDRRKDMILVGGENVYPAEVEDVLARHERVAESAVIGIPHEVWGEEVLAFVVPRADPAAPEGDGRPPDPRELIRHCRRSLARYKCPTRVELTDRLPRNAAGKLQKRLLREPWWEGRDRRV